MKRTLRDSGDGRACPRRRSGLRPVERWQLLGQRAERRQPLVDRLVAGFDGAGRARPRVPTSTRTMSASAGRERADRPGPAGHDAGRRPRRRFRRRRSARRAMSTSKPLYWAGKLFYRTPDGDYVCSAQFISPNVILTAAHCVRDSRHRRLVQGLHLRASVQSRATMARSIPMTASPPRTAGCSRVSRSTSTTTP